MTAATPHTDDTAVDGPVFRLIYRSRSLVPAERRDAEIESIFRAARANNRALGVTGALLVYEDLFAQTLEGDAEVVRTLVERIARDPRHDHVEIIDTARIETRVFPRWAMAAVSPVGRPDISLVAARDGYTVVTSHGTTPAQDRILEMMRALLFDFPVDH